METIDKVLKYTHNLQAACFGSPVCVSIEAGQGVTANKLLCVRIYAGTDEPQTYIITSEMPAGEIYNAWGAIKDNVARLRQQHKLPRINKHGRVKEPPTNDE